MNQEFKDFEEYFTFTGIMALLKKHDSLNDNKLIDFIMKEKSHYLKGLFRSLLKDELNKAMAFRTKISKEWQLFMLWLDTDNYFLVEWKEKSYACFEYDGYFYPVEYYVDAPLSNRTIPCGEGVSYKNKTML